MVIFILTGTISDSFPLPQLITTDNEFSKFLKRHKITFENINGKLEIFYVGKHVSLDKNNRPYCNYLKSRLGHYKGHEDYCFNGFAFKDLLYKHNYAKLLEDVPEFINQLSQFLEYRNLGTDYYENSRYYCFEYCVPLNKVLFDENDDLTLSEKKKHLFRKVFNRLYDYIRFDVNYMYGNDNPCLRLKDDDVMQKEYYRGREEITADMLK